MRRFGRPTIAEATNAVLSIAMLCIIIIVVTSAMIYGLSCMTFNSLSGGYHCIIVGD